FAPIGPVIATKDEVADPQNLQIKMWINGELKQDYNTSHMTNSVATQIAWLTQYITLNPGDVIGCGVHHMGLSPINDGDRIQMEVQGLERLELNVVSHGPRKDAEWRPPGTRSA
ncbi:MAG: fumarylacetoacetate hydrolase family protein, partial [Dehalococcoidia bacterium]